MDEKSQLAPRPNGDITKIPTKIGVSDENGHAVDITDSQTYRHLSTPSPTYLGSTPTQSYLGSMSQQPFRRRSDSMTKTEDGDQNESKVLVIYTGGTIGMIRNDDNSKWINLRVTKSLPYLRLYYDRTLVLSWNVSRVYKVFKCNSTQYDDRIIWS